MKEDFPEYEDALNTLSGSSSFGSLGEIPQKLFQRSFYEGCSFYSDE